MKKHVFFFILILLAAAHTGAKGIELNRPGLTVEETFDIYVKAVQKSDIEALFTTVTDSDAFFFLTSRGKLLDTRQDYRKFHEDWFKESDWEMPVDFVEAREGKEYGYATAVYHYRSKLDEGGTYNLDSYFTLIFHREDGMWKAVADICTPIERSISEKNKEIKYTSEQVFLLNTIKNRRTVRQFKSTPVPKEHIFKILEASHFAPTAGNQQPWKYLVIQDRAKLDLLSEKAHQWYLEKYKNQGNPSAEQVKNLSDRLKKVLKNVLSAPVYVAVLVDTRVQHPDYILYDGTLAAGTMMIAARALGYGTGFFTTFFPEKEMKEFFKIPDQYRLICFSPIGVPSQWPDPPSKKNIEDLVIFESF
jgi:nitroreductase/ketosteroid isomerase-like protein